MCRIGNSGEVTSLLHKKRLEEENEYRDLEYFCSEECFDKRSCGILGDFNHNLMFMLFTPMTSMTGPLLI